MLLPEEIVVIHKWLGTKEVPMTPDLKRPWEIVWRYPAFTDALAVACLRKLMQEAQPVEWPWDAMLSAIMGQAEERRDITEAILIATRDYLAAKVWAV